MKLKKGDKIKIMVGKDRGKETTVEKVFTTNGTIGAAGVNMFKRHSKPRAAGQKGQIVEFSKPISVANVALICPKCKQVTRVGYKLTQKEKVRVCRKCDQEI
jgi:large subunit ribosomal protein L24